MEIELTWAVVNDVIIKANTGDPSGYSLANIKVGYETIESQDMANELMEECRNGKYKFEKISFIKKGTFDRGSVFLINENVNISKSSLNGIMILFKAPAGSTGAEAALENYVYPNLNKIDISIDELANERYAMGMTKYNFWDSMTRKFGKGQMLMKDFFETKFGVYIDLRTYPDNSTFGSGLKTITSSDGVTLAIHRSTLGSGNLDYYIYAFSDEYLKFNDGQFGHILH